MSSSTRFVLRNTRALAAVVILSATCGSVRAQTAPASSPLAVPEVRVEKVELSDIGADGVVASVRLSAMARNSATLRAIVFDQITINGVRVHVPAVAGPIRMKAGEAIDGLPDLRATLMYRELDSLEPLRRAVRDGAARVHAVVRAQLEMNLFEKLILRTGDAWVTFAIDQDVPIGIPGGALGRVAAVGALLAAEPVWIAGQSAQEWRRNRTALAGKVRGSLAGNLVMLETRYELRARDGETALLHGWSCGFRMGNGEVVAPAEAVEPWNFDDSMAQALESGDVSVDASKTEILATPVAAGRTYSLQRKELRILRMAGGSETAISIADKRRYHVRFRDRDENAVLLEIPALKDAGGGLEASARMRRDGDWQPAAVVRFDGVGNGGNEGAPVVWLTEARWEDGRYRIKDSVDASAFGSPLWTSDGVVGLLQDESSAAEIDGLLKKLR